MRPGCQGHPGAFTSLAISAHYCSSSLVHRKGWLVFLSLHFFSGREARVVLGNTTKAVTLELCHALFKARRGHIPVTRLPAEPHQPCHNISLVTGNDMGQGEIRLKARELLHRCLSDMILADATTLLATAPHWVTSSKAQCRPIMYQPNELLQHSPLCTRQHLNHCWTFQSCFHYLM